MLEQSASIADRIAGLHDHILVDEYQDTNLLQARILRGMCRRHRNVTVVGDDAQSIYSFRGASFRNILEFPKQFDGTSVVRSGAKLPLDAADSRRDEHAHLARARAVHEAALDGAHGRRCAVARDGARRAGADALRRRPDPRAARGRHAAARDRGARARRLHVGRPRDRARQSQDPVREVGRAQVPRGRAREGRAGVSPRAGESARRGELVQNPDAPARHRRRDGARDDGLDGRAGVGSGCVLALRSLRRARATRTRISLRLLRRLRDGGRQACRRERRRGHRRDSRAL